MVHPSLSVLTVLLLLPAVLSRSVQQQVRIRKLPPSLSPKSQRNSRAVPSVLQKSHLKLRNAPPPNLVMHQYGSDVIECEAGGNPPPTIHWLKDGKIIRQDHSKLRNSVDEDIQEEKPILGVSLTRSRLFIDCATPYDEAVYTCVAENPYTRVSRDSRVRVEREPLGHRSSSSCLAKKSFGTPARITMWTHTRLEIVGSTVHLFCRPIGTPEPDVMWFDQDKNALVDSEKYKILDNGDLEIRNIAWDDMGTYTCVAENSHGADETSTFLYPTLPDKA